MKYQRTADILFAIYMNFNSFTSSTTRRMGTGLNFLIPTMNSIISSLDSILYIMTLRIL